MKKRLSIKTIGIFGFGAFGRLMARHLKPHFNLLIHDPHIDHQQCAELGFQLVTAETAAGCDMVILAVPVSEIGRLIATITPHLRPGTVVTDVGSVKLLPVKLMEQGLPPHVDIVGTHPLFGPQSAATGVAGRKITICPVRGASARRVGAFLRRQFGLKVLMASAEEHDREAAVVQGVTHLVAKVLVGMEPLPKRLTTASFDHLMQAVNMVRYDAASVFEAIERDNPFAAGVREQFQALIAETKVQLERHT